jgi:hypothetical protein
LAPDSRLLRRARLRFVDPDNLAETFTTDDYVPGWIAATVPCGRETYWVFRADRPIEYWDGTGDDHTGDTFLLKPSGLDAATEMKVPPGEAPTSEIWTLVLHLPDGRYPERLVPPPQGPRLHVVSAGRLIPG